jgi:hypothetical protein
MAFLIPLDAETTAKGPREIPFPPEIPPSEYDNARQAMGLRPGKRTENSLQCLDLHAALIVGFHHQQRR